MEIQMRGLEPFSALLKCLTWEWSANLTYDTFSCHNRDINAYTYIKQYYQPRTESFILAHLLWVASKTHSAAQFLDAIINWLPPDSFSIEFPFLGMHLQATSWPSDPSGDGTHNLQLTARKHTPNPANKTVG